MEEGNKRTADVRAKSFAEMFSLSRSDFEMAMIDYPDMISILRRRARSEIIVVWFTINNDYICLGLVWSSLV